MAWLGIIAGILFAEALDRHAEDRPSWVPFFAGGVLVTGFFLGQLWAKIASGGVD